MPQITTDVTRIINAPIGQVWGIVTSFGAEVLWFPGCVSSSLEGYGPGSVRTIRWEPNDWVNGVREVMLFCDPVKHHLRFQVYNEDVGDAMGDLFSNIVLENIDDKSTKFRWYGESTPLEDPVKMASLKEYVEDMYARCAEAIGEKLLRK
ncbi:bet v i allergen [Stagonosporopsis vannaccii]|nr:bet v i allergen [Stagonosporopsis vannaccii]